MNRNQSTSANRDEENFHGKEGLGRIDWQDLDLYCRRDRSQAFYSKYNRNQRLELYEILLREMLFAFQTFVRSAEPNSIRDLLTKNDEHILKLLQNQGTTLHYWANEVTRPYNRSLTCDEIQMQDMFESLYKARELCLRMRMPTFTQEDGIQYRVRVLLGFVSQHKMGVKFAYT